MAEGLKYIGLTADDIKETLQKVLNDPKYMKKREEIFRKISG